MSAILALASSLYAWISSDNPHASALRVAFFTLIGVALTAMTDWVGQLDLSPPLASLVMIGWTSLVAWLRKWLGLLESGSDGSR